MDRRALGPEQIVAEFQRRRRLSRGIRIWTAVLGIGCFVGGALLGMSLRVLQEHPYVLLSGLGVSWITAVFGAPFGRYVYRCPCCDRRVEVPDTTDSGNVLLEDPAWCPHCGSILK